MKKSYLFLLLYFCFFTTILTAQPVNNKFEASKVGQLKYETIFLSKTIYYSTKNEFKGIVKKPLPFILTCSGIALLSMGDDEVKQFFLKNQSKGATDFFNTINHLGDSEKLLAAYGGLYLSGWIFKKPAIRITSIELVSAYAISGLITTGAKKITGRARPYLEKEQYYFDGPVANKERYYSFPSGHVTISFSTASVLAHHTKNPWLKAGIYSTATAVSTARMYKNKHWFSDVVTGGLIGYFTGKIVVKVSEKLNKG